MEIKTIEENLYPEDRCIAAVNCECGLSTVNDVLAGRRNRETELGKQIMTELERIAKINIKADEKKTKVQPK